MNTLLIVKDQWIYFQNHNLIQKHKELQHITLWYDDDSEKNQSITES